jgi:hypothetical protein
LKYLQEKYKVKLPESDEEHVDLILYWQIDSADGMRRGFHSNLRISLNPRLNVADTPVINMNEFPIQVSFNS